MGILDTASELIATGLFSYGASSDGLTKYSTILFLKDNDFSFSVGTKMWSERVVDELTGKYFFGSYSIPTDEILSRVPKDLAVKLSMHLDLLT